MKKLAPLGELERKNREWWRLQDAYLSSGQLLGHVDSIVGNQKESIVEVVIKGWLFHPEQLIGRVKFPLFDQQRAVCLYGLDRADVLEAFPGALQAGASGFIIAAHVAPDVLASACRQLSFVAELKGGASVQGNFAETACSPWPSVNGSKDNRFVD